MDDSESSGDSGDHSPDAPMQDVYGRSMDAPFFIIAVVLLVLFAGAIFFFK